MSLGQEGKPPRERKMLVYRANGAKGEVSTLIRFTAPADIQGTGLHTIDGADGVSNQWIYLPAMQRVRSGEIGFAQQHLLECGFCCRNTCFGLSDSGPGGYDGLRGCASFLLSCPFFKQSKLLPRDITLCRSLLKCD